MLSAACYRILNVLLLHFLNVTENYPMTIVALFQYTDVLSLIVPGDKFNNISFMKAVIVMNLTCSGIF